MGARFIQYETGGSRAEVLARHHLAPEFGGVVGLQLSPHVFPSRAEAEKEVKWVAERGSPAWGAVFQRPDGSAAWLIGAWLYQEGG